MGTCPARPQFIPELAESFASGTSGRRLIATIPVTKHIKDELDSAGDSQLFEDSVDVIPDRMFLHFEPLSDLTVLHAVGDQTHHILLATGQQRDSFGVVQMNRLDMG